MQNERATLVSSLCLLLLVAGSLVVIVGCVPNCNCTRVQKEKAQTPDDTRHRKSLHTQNEFWSERQWGRDRALALYIPYF